MKWSVSVATTDKGGSGGDWAWGGGEKGGVKASVPRQRTAANSLCCAVTGERSLVALGVGVKLVPALSLWLHWLPLQLFLRVLQRLSRCLCNI